MIESGRSSTRWNTAMEFLEKIKAPAVRVEKQNDIFTEEACKKRIRHAVP
jgi:hypothetical protein